uniref:ribosomal protein L2 n=1 Tax=Cocconeiopsis kantsiensis TaxID=3082010 RepID=UPI003003542A
MKNQSNLKKIKNVIKNSIKGKKRSSGRNNLGKITVRHKGGGHKKQYRKIDFYRNEKSVGVVCSIEYDPNRNTFICSVYDFIEKKFTYIIAPKNIKIGDIVETGESAKSNLGHSLRIEKIPLGSYIYNIAPTVFKKGQISRSAGTFSQLKEKTVGYAIIKLSSGSHKTLSSKCFASIGVVSNENFYLKKLKKAGQSRWKGVRPSVRGVAMNPIDHPHGGGEGKKSGKNRTPWGKFNK